jgi:hypothetical protein
MGGCCRVKVFLVIRGEEEDEESFMYSKEGSTKEVY